MNNKSVLLHYGILGMRWGHHKIRTESSNVRSGHVTTSSVSQPKGYKIYGDGRIKIKKGTELQRLVGKNNKQDIAGMTYASFTKNDNARYINTIAGKGLFGGGRDTKLTLIAKENLKSPSNQEATKVFFELLRDNPKLKNLYNETPLVSLDKISDKQINKFIAEPDSKKAYHAYRLANISFMFDGMKDVKSQYFTELNKKGYNMLRDENDVGNLYARNPVLLFDGSKSTSINAREFVTDAMRREAKVYTKENIHKGKEYLREFGFNVEIPLE